MESSWITRREIRTQTNPYLVTDTIRVVWSGTSPDIPRSPQRAHIRYSCVACQQNVLWLQVLGG